MTEFEDNLWRELEGAYGAELSDSEGPLHGRSRLRTPAFATTTLGVAGAGAVGLVLLTAGSPAPAFAVTPQRDGTVSVVIRRIDGIRGANQRLAQLGIRARAVQVAAGCQPQVARPVPGVPVMTLATGRRKNWVTATPGTPHTEIRPRQIPAGRILVIPAVRAGKVVRLVHGRMFSGAVPVCLPPAVRIQTAIAGRKFHIVACRAGVIARPAPATDQTVTAGTNTNAGAPPQTVTQVLPAPAAAPQTATNTNTDATTTGAAPPPPGPATGPAAVPPPLLRACRLAAQAAAK